MSTEKVKIGITGGIGSGKTTFAKYISDLGFNVINADEIAKEIMTNNEVVISDIKTLFGDEAFNGKELNKKFLAEQVFSDKEKLEKLNSIVHPPTIDKIYSLMAEQHKSKNIAFVEAAVLYEAKMDRMFDFVIAVIADDELRIKRASENYSISEEEVKARMDNQLPESTIKGRSDFMVVNNGSPEELKNNAAFYVNLFNTLAINGNVAKYKADEPEEGTQPLTNE